MEEMGLGRHLIMVIFIGADNFGRAAAIWV